MEGNAINALKSIIIALVVLTKILASNVRKDLPQSPMEVNVMIAHLSKITALDVRVKTLALVVGRDLYSALIGNHAFLALISTNALVVLMKLLVPLVKMDFPLALIKGHALIAIRSL